MTKNVEHFISFQYMRVISGLDHNRHVETASKNIGTTYDCTSRGETRGEVSGHFNSHRRGSLVDSFKRMCPVPGNKINGCITQFKSIKLK